MITFKHADALQYIKEFLPTNPIIVEAGAFDGKETIKMAQMWPQGTIHSFEPVPAIFQKLQSNVAHFANVHSYQLALSDTNGTATLHISEKPTKPGVPSQANSLLKPKKRLELSSLIFTHTIQVPTITLDHWAQQYAIDRVDFLWLDLQGYELNVMKASPNILAKTQVIYTEVEFLEAYENQFLYEDVKSWLESKGFTMVAKDFHDNPSWFFGNALFIKN